MNNVNMNWKKSSCQLLSNSNPNRRVKLNRSYQLRYMSIPGDFDPSLQKKVKQMSGQFQAWDPRSVNHAIYGSKAMVDDDRPAFVSPLSLVAGLTVSWLGQPSTTTPALEGLVVTPAQINSSASNRRRHQRPGSWSTHSETAGSAQVGLHSATHSWQVDPSRVSVQTDKRTIESSPNYISNLNSFL